MTDFVPLLDFIPALTPTFTSPRHLEPLTGAFERIAAGEEIQEAFSVPPRFGKTETILHGMGWLLARQPWLQIAYLSYGSDIAEKKSRRARGLAQRAGVPLAADAQSRSNWRTGVEEGGVTATGVSGQITGEGFHVIVMDDLHKGRAEAESAAARDRVRGWLMMDVLSRLEPGGSIILNGTRWHPDDAIGHAIGLGWYWTNMSALDAEGNSLWPERWPADRLIERRETLGGEQGYEWQSLYCGNPRARGDRTFGDVTTYGELPDGGHDDIGLDFHYSTKASSDWSVAVPLRRVGNLHYVHDVVRTREDPSVFRDRVKALVARFPRARLRAYVAGTEIGIVKFFGEKGLHVQTAPASTDKFTRAIDVAAAWNTGRILLPATAPWLDAFVSEVCGFTGVRDAHDDQVDALAAAYMLSSRSTVGSLISTGSERSFSSRRGVYMRRTGGRDYSLSFEERQRRWLNSF